MGRLKAAPTTAESAALAMVAVLTCLLPVTAAAQGRGGSAQSRQTVLDVFSEIVTAQDGDFGNDRTSADAVRDTFTRLLRSSIATLPVSGSSGGFTYRLNPVLGTMERASQSFGPFYVERALTAGAGRASFSVIMQQTSFGSLDGYDLRNGDFVTQAIHVAGGDDPFDTQALTLDIRARTVTFFANVGVADQVDIAVAAPLIQLNVEGARVSATRGRTRLETRAAAGAFGLGDVALRTKVRLTGPGPAAVSAGVEAWLPTGREEDLLGGGGLAIGFFSLASYESGRAGIYGNVSFRRNGLAPELTYGGSVAVAATPRLTIVGEMLARRPIGLPGIAKVVTPHPFIRGIETTRLMPTDEDRTTRFGVAGFKWNVGGTWLLNGHVIVPLTDKGLTARITPAVSLDYSLTR